MFPRTHTAPCIIPPVVPPDARCLSSEFALANPTLCPSGALILKPSVAFLCQLESVEFRVFEYAQGVETELTTGVRFSSSNNNVLAIGVNSGNGTAIGTGLEAGTVQVTATHNGRMAIAETTVMPGVRCCDEVRVLTAIVVDNSLSMSLDFNTPDTVTPYPKRLTFAKAMATSYGGAIYHVDGVPKDADRVWSVNSAVTAGFGFSNNTEEITDAIAAITQTQNRTDLLAVFTTITNDLLVEVADRRVLLLISDGEHTSNTNRQAVLDAAGIFKSLGGIVAIVGIRASGAGYDLLERLATPGFFLNATAGNADEVIGQFNYLKSLVCAGFCEPMGDVYVNQPALDYFGFTNWEVTSGQANLIGEDLLNLLGISGLYVELNGGTPAIMRTLDSYPVVAGRDYRVSFSAAGNQRQSIIGQGIKVYLREVGANDSDPNLFEASVYPAWDSTLEAYSFAFNSTIDGNVKVYLQQLYSGTAPTIGNLIDNVTLDEVTTSTILLSDTFDEENLVYIPPRCGVSGALTEVADPDEPEIEWVGDFGTDLGIDGQFNYGISYVTTEGETAAALVEYVRTDTNAHSQTVRRLTIPQSASDRVTNIRIWRSLGEEAADPTATALFLLAEVAPGTTLYLDQEDEAAFTARYEPSVEAPTVNTTAVAAGGLGYGYYAPCCYYEPGEATVPLVPEMTSNTSPSGVVDSGTAATISGNYWWAFKESEDLSIEKWIGECDFATGAVADTEWVSYQFPAPQTVAAYSFSTHFSLAEQEPPYGWYLEGSNDGSAWTLLDTRTNVTDWVYAVPKTFTIASPASFSYYRITFTQARAGSDTEFTINALQFYGGSPATEFTDNCPPCTPGTPGAQSADPNALPDIELGVNPPVSPTVQVCVQCETGFSNFTNVAGAPETVVTTNPNRKLLNWDLAAGSVAKAISLVSNSFVVGQGHNYTLRGHTASLAGTINSGTVVTSGTISSSGSFILDIPANAFTHYQLDITRAGLISTELTVAATLFIPNAAQVCATAATAALATEAANALLNCKPVYTATASYTAKCTTGFGQDVSRSATRSSMRSQAEAQRLAEEAAQEAAEAALDCEQSNNTLPIQFNNGDMARATPYASWLFVEGETGVISNVTVTLKNFRHLLIEDAVLVLQSPDGTAVMLLNKAAASSYSNGGDFTFDQAAATTMPSGTPIAPGTYKPTIQASGETLQLPSPAPTQPYAVTMAAFNGGTPNGHWALFGIHRQFYTVFSANDARIIEGWTLQLTTA